MRNVTKMVLLVCTALTALAFTSCEAIAEVTGQSVAKTTTWIRLTPAAAVDIDGIQTATLTLDFSRPVAGLSESLTPQELAELITFEFDYPTGTLTEEKLRAIKVVKMAEAEAMYALTVANVPGNAGIAQVTVNIPNITPPFRPWSLDGRVIPDVDASAALLDFRFERSKNSSLTVDEVVGSIDQLRGSVVVVVPMHTILNPLKPSVLTALGNTYTPLNATNFEASVPYTVTSSKTQLAKDYVVSVIPQTPESARLYIFNFIKEENTAAGLAVSVYGIIDEGTKTVSITVPYGTSRNALKPNITHSGESIAPAHLAAQNFTNPVQYTVSSANGDPAVYTVNVFEGVAKDAGITDFAFMISDNPGKGLSDDYHPDPLPAYSGLITEPEGSNPGTILVVLPTGAELDGLKPRISFVNSVVPNTLVAQDFSNSKTVPIPYVVTSLDRTVSRIYNVSVIRQAATDAFINDFTFMLSDNGGKGLEDSFHPSIIPGYSGVITEPTNEFENASILVALPAGADLNGLAPRVSFMGLNVKVAGEIVAPGVPVAQDWTGGDLKTISYVVSSLDGTVHRTYEVKLITQVLRYYAAPIPRNAPAGGISGALNNDGRSWGSACSDIQTLIELAKASYALYQQPIDIWAAEGTYLNLRGKGTVIAMSGTEKIRIYGGFRGYETAPIGSLPEDRESWFNNYPALAFGNEYGTMEHGAVISTLDAGGLNATVKVEGASAFVLDGFTIKRGIEGGLRIKDTPATSLFTHLVVSTNINTGSGGGGILITGGEPRLDKLTVRGNSTATTGGGICIDGSTALITNILVESNTATRQGGGIAIIGANPRLENIVLVGNKASLAGGGIYNWYSNPLIMNALISANTCDDQASSATDSAKELGGAGIYTTQGNIVLVNALISGNKTAVIWARCADPNGYGGGGIKMDDGKLALINCTVSGNCASYDMFGGNTNLLPGGGIFAVLPYSDSTVDAYNCLIVGNAGAVAGGLTEDIATFFDGWATTYQPNQTVYTLAEVQMDYQIGKFTAYNSIVGGCSSELLNEGGVIDGIAAIVAIGAGSNNVDGGSYANFYGDEERLANVKNLFVKFDALPTLTNTGADNMADWTSNQHWDFHLDEYAYYRVFDSGTTLPFALFPDITDLEGNPRIRNGAPDMGAYEALTVHSK